MASITSDLILSDKFPEVVDLLSIDEVSEFAASAEQEIKSMKEDYFNDLSDEKFGADYIFHESVIMKALAYRWATADRFDLLAEKAVAALNNSNNVREACRDDFLVHPIFYLRQSKPGYVRDNIKRQALLDGQPHYDRAFGVFAFTFWVALRDASIETGGLAFFKNSNELDKEFKIDWGDRNKYNYDKYVDACSSLDQLLSETLIHPRIDAGSAYLFHSNILHGSTKALKDTRLSFDFRLIHKDDLNTASKEDQYLIMKFNEDINLSHCYGLHFLGDSKGIERHPSRSDVVNNILDRLPVAADIKIPQQLLRWRFEYAWYRQNLA
ncbi:MAG: phytanoyl-CoA dioxygenase family protein [Rhodospirillaceae bacterium]